MPSLRFAPYREIASEVAGRLAAEREGCDPLAPWVEGVIVPSRGVADGIASALLRRMPGGVAGLPLHSLEALATRILAAKGQTPRVASEGERRLAMRSAVRAFDHPMMSSRGVASMLERSYRDVRDRGITLDELSRRVRKARGFRDAQRTRLVLEAWSEYERRIERLHAIDPADLLERAAVLVDAEVGLQLLAGFYDMTGVQLRLVEALLREGLVSAIWVPTRKPFAQPFLQSLAPHTGLPPEGEASALETQPETTLTPHDTGPDELRDVCARVAGLLASGVPASDIGIVARSFEPYDVRLLNRFAAERDFATTMAEETPLAAHRIGRGALTLLRLRERGFLRGEVLDLVRGGLRTKSVLDVNAADAETRRARIAGGTREELLRMRRRAPIIEAYIALVAELEALTAANDLSLLERLGSLFRIETSADLTAVEKLDEVAALFRRATEGGWGALTVHDAIDAIEQQTVPAGLRAAPGSPVWAGEVARFRGRSFRHLFVVRMEDDVFPQRRTEDPLLPDSDRQLLGLREIGDGREEEELLFSLLAESASESVHFSHAAGDGFGKVLRPSRYVRTMSVERGSAGAPPLVRPEFPNAARQLQLLVRSGTASPFDGHVAGIDPSTLRLSPTQLEDLGECPQKFLFKHILGVRDVDHPERELQIHHRDKGTLDHKVLERFYSSLSDQELSEAHASLPRLPAALEQRLDQFVDEQFDEHENDAPPFNRTVRGIERRATRRILRDFVVNDLADLESQGLVPAWFEYRFGSRYLEQANHPEPFVVEVDGATVRVEGTIDRIDKGIGTYRIVDYKSGQALRHANLGDKIDRGVRLQLALYAMAVTEFFGTDPKNVSGTIKPLVIGATKPAKFAFSLEEKREALLETLGIFVRAIRNGTFPAFPNETDDINSCKYCPVNHSCRTRHDLEERYAVQRHEDPRTLLGGGS